MTRLLAAGLALAALAACGGHGAKPTFNALPSEAATAPAKAPYVPKVGHSDVHMSGDIVVDTTQDYQCSYAPDDFFVRGAMGSYDGVPLYLSINVEFYKGPGAYPKKTQVLLRRVSDDSSVYASWYQGFASGTVLPRGQGADLAETVLEPEAGTSATGRVVVRGHFGCLAKPSPGPG